MYNSKPNKETQIKYLTHVSHKYSFHKSQTIKIIISLWTKAVPDEGRKWRRSSPSGSSGVQREIIILIV
jgi:hypothetical protein